MNVEIRMVDAVHLFNGPDDAPSVWMDATRFHYRQLDTTYCLSSPRKAGLRIYDLLFFLDGALCVAVPCCFNTGKGQTIDRGTHPMAGSDLIEQKPTLEELSPVVTDVLRRLIPPTGFVLFDIKKRRQCDVTPDPDALLTREVDYFWLPEVDADDQIPYHGPIHEQSVAFLCRSDPVEAVVRRYWTRFDQWLGPYHFSAYVLDGTLQDAERLVDEWNAISEQPKDRFHRMRSFMEDHCLLAVDNEQYGWGVRITTTKLDRNDIVRMLGDRITG